MVSLEYYHTPRTVIYKLIYWFDRLHTCEPVISTPWTLLMVSIKLWASSIMTTLPSSFIPQASLVDLWRRMLYGKTTSWKLTQNLQQLIHALF